jgi:hypothetical protein
MTKKSNYRYRAIVPTGTSCSRVGQASLLASVLAAVLVAALPRYAEAGSSLVEPARLKELLSADERIFESLQKELERNESKLIIKNEAKPYFMSLAVTDIHS